MQQGPRVSSEARMLRLSLCSGTGDPAQTTAIAWASLTGDAGDAEHMSVADSELVHHCARLIGIDNDNFTGRQRAGENPHTAGCGVHFMELLCLRDSKHSVRFRVPLRSLSAC